MFEYITSGDSAIIIKAGDMISEDINRNIRKLLLAIEREKIKGINDFIPSYNELMICYDPLQSDYREMCLKIQEIENKIQTISLPSPSVFHIPVLYGGEYGPDIHVVAKANNLTEEEVIRIHSSGIYLVYMLGFTPGFCYLGGLDKRLCTPRREDPRIKIPAGSVGIAEFQTGIYPIESPGGWHLIGKTPVRIFNPDKKPEFLIDAGNYIKFNPVNMDEYMTIQKEVDDRNYTVKITGKE